MNSFFENIVNSYETRLRKIQIAFQSSENLTETSHYVFDSVHHSLTNLKQERELLNTKLCEILAKQGSLRKKDYNTMMSGLLGMLDEKEKEAEQAFQDFIESQKETARTLKNSILDLKDLTIQDTGKIAIVKGQLEQISGLQETRKEAVLKTFTDFQKMHNRMMECLAKLVEKGDHLLVQDIRTIAHQMHKEINCAGNQKLN